MTSDQEEFRAPGVEEKDLLWDHVGNIQQIVFENVSETSSTNRDNQITATYNDQIENIVQAQTGSDVGNIAVNTTHRENKLETTTVNKSVGSSTVNYVSDLEKPHFEVVAKKGERIVHQNPLTERKTKDGHSFKLNNESNLEKTISKKLIFYEGKQVNNTNKEQIIHNAYMKSKFDTKKIIYNPSDPYSIIFGEVKTEFLTDKYEMNEKRYNTTISGKINTGIQGVKEMMKKYNKTFETFKELKEGLRDSKKYKTIKVTKFHEEKESFGSEQEEKEMTEGADDLNRIDDGKNNINDLSKNKHYTENSKSLFKEWDTVSEEQEKVFEQMVLQGQKNKDSNDIPQTGRWFLLLLAGNSTIVKLRQKDFAKYLKLNLAARLSLEYDDLRVNKVILIPPRLMVNVSVMPSVEGGVEDIDEEFELDDDEEEAPLHKLAETNATLLELSGEEYHVVRFLSLRSQIPVSLDDEPSATSMIVNDRHGDIEIVIFVAVGGACAVVIIATAVIALLRYLRTANISWPFKTPKPLWGLPRHQRMDETVPSIGGPLTVIYSGSFVDRHNGSSSGSWIDDYQPNSIYDEEPILEVQTTIPVYGFGALSNTALPEIREAESNAPQDSPRFSLDSKLHILGCRPNQLLLPHRPLSHKNTLDVRIHGKGVDNPNYQT